MTIYIASDWTNCCILGGFSGTTLECDPVTLVLKTLWGDEALNARSLGVWLAAFLLWLDLTANDKLANL